MRPWGTKKQALYQHVAKLPESKTESIAFETYPTKQEEEPLPEEELE